MTNIMFENDGDRIGFEATRGIVRSFQSDGFYTNEFDLSLDQARELRDWLDDVIKEYR